MDGSNPPTTANFLPLPAMQHFIIIGIMLLIALIVSLLWIKGIDSMKKKHPNYKGEDFLNWGNDEHQRAAAGRDGWDEEWYPHETI